MAAHAQPTRMSERAAVEVSTDAAASTEAPDGAGRLLRGFLPYVRPHRRHLLLTALFGALGFSLSYVYPWITGAVVDVIAASDAVTTPDERAKTVLRLTAIAALAAVLHGVVVYGRGHFNIRLGHGIVTDLRRALFDHVQRLSLGFFTRTRTGSILSRILNDVQEATSLIYTGGIVALLDTMQLVVTLVLIMQINGKLTLACLALFPVYGLVFAVMNPRVQRASERVHRQLCRISGNVAEQLAGQALVKTYTAEQRESDRLASALKQHHCLVRRQSHQGHLVAGAGEMLVHLGTTLVVGYGGWLALGGEMTAGMMTRFLGYMLIMFGPVRRFAELNLVFHTSLSSMRRIFRVFAIEPTVVEAQHPVKRVTWRGHVRFEDVWFRYEDTARETTSLDEEDDGTVGVAYDAPTKSWVLEGLSLEAKPGERIAIVGPSGTGKTTLVSLIPRLYDVSAGSVSVDGIDVRDYALEALRSAIAIVQQDSFLFSGTVMDNIAYGRPDASDEEITRAAIAAHAHEFIVRLPEGYATPLGERGVTLSSGQRQRLSIARALLKDPRILILDEATSALDAESEALVQKALEAVMESRTCFIVAHRLSTVRNADRIVVLDGGHIAEIGTHDALLERGGVYAKLVRCQMALVG